MASQRSTPWAYERGSGLVAVTGPTVGATLIVLVLFAVLYTSTPLWIETWVAACGAGLVASGILAWLWSSRLGVASRVGLVASTIGLALATPTLFFWVYGATTGAAVVSLDLLAFAAGTSILCTCYMSLLAAHFIRNERLAADERRARRAAQATRRRPSIVLTPAWLAAHAAHSGGSTRVGYHLRSQSVRATPVR